MPTPQQENLDQMIRNVLEDFPLYEAGKVKRAINDEVRGMISRRPWSGLVKYGQLIIPAQYTTGTASATLNSAIITGSATSWPVSDSANTTLSADVSETGLQVATPASMTGILAGTWVVIGAGTAGQEAVFVISVTKTTFIASFAATHATGIAVTRSSLAGLQFRIGQLAPFSTVTGVTTTTQLLVDRVWPVATASAQGYTISMVFASLAQDVKEVFTMVNLSRQFQIKLDCPKAMVDYHDPRRTSVESTSLLIFHETDPGGSPLYELYPRPTSQQVFPYFYKKDWPALESDYDFLPSGIRSDVIVKRAKAHAARWPGHKKLDGGIYYDPKLAESLIVESERDIVLMKTEDDSTNIMSMMWDYRRWPFSNFGANWRQSHDFQEDWD